MVDDTDLQALARRYLDLWERQVAESANDPAAARALAQWLSPVSGPDTPGDRGEAPAPSGGNGRKDD